MTTPLDENKLPSLRTVAMPSDTNASGDIFGGWIMSQMDIAGVIFASYIVKGRLVTVAVDAMKFHLPVMVGDQVSCFCELKRIGTTSIAIQVETWVRRRHSQEAHFKVTEATYTYVGVDDNRQPTPLEVVENKK